ALQKITCINMHEVSRALKPVLLPGEVMQIKIVREGKEKNQGIGYLPDGTMVVINNAQSHVGQQIDVEVSSLLQTGAGVIIFAEIRPTVAAA
ncbi:MAG TPA: TRAM domain-containing protein, partial [Candidatus Baltobacteraceae bacterium]|nr:TRAM domain-containing protein [Candidatus Baltobacteraceae bacterium]